MAWRGGEGRGHPLRLWDEKSRRDCLEVSRAPVGLQCDGVSEGAEWVVLPLHVARLLPHALKAPPPPQRERSKGQGAGGGSVGLETEPSEGWLKTVGRGTGALVLS